MDKVALIYTLHDNLLELLCGAAEQRHTGVAAAARDLKQQRRVTPSLCNTLVRFDWTYNFVRHLTTQHANQFFDEVHHTIAPRGVHCKDEYPSSQQRSTVVDVMGSMSARRDDDEISNSTVYPSSINELYDTSWSDIGADANHSTPDATAQAEASTRHAVLSPRAGQGGAAGSRRTGRARQATSARHRDARPHSIQQRHRSRTPPAGDRCSRDESIIREAIKQLNDGRTRVHIHGLTGKRIRAALRTRPDTFAIQDTVSAKGIMAFNVCFAHGAREKKASDGPTVFPVGGYHRAYNPFPRGHV